MLGSAAQRQRRGHNKSRNGCQQCKKNHTKCDETRPECHECARRQVACSFSTPLKTADSGTSDVTTFSLDNIALLHHWLKGDAAFFDDHDKARAQEERHAQMDLALAHPYLLHSILAIAALDRFHLQPDRTMLHQQATHHNAIAIKHARPNLTNSSKDHSAALYLFSAFSMFFALAEPPLRLLTHLRDTVDPVNDLLDAFRMGRGVASIGEVRQDDLKKQGLPNKDIWHDERSEVSVLSSQYAAVEALIRETLPGGRLAVECTKAANELFSTIELLQKKSENDSSAHLIATWGMHVDAVFLEACAARSPVALVLLAHYAVVMHIRRNLWFLQRWPAILIEDIAHKLGQKWSHALAWPKSVIVEGSAID